MPSGAPPLSGPYDQEVPELSPSRVTMATAAAAAALTLRALARPLPGNDRRMVDWETVRRIALERCGETPGSTWEGPEASRLGRRYDVLAAELVGEVARVLGEPVGELPPFTVIGRRRFVETNVAIVERLLAPVERLRARIPETPVTALSRTGLSRYLGELLGLLSRRVLGQYDPVLLVAGAGTDDPSPPVPALYLVEPNVVAVERRHGVDGEALRRWLVLHELTHAWQFQAHPWLRRHLGELLGDLMLRDLVEGLGGLGEPAPGRARGGAVALRALPHSVRRQLGAVARVQAVMSVCEGHGNFVMRRVGRTEVVGWEEVERALGERSQQRPLLERLVFAVTGLRLKLRQYQLGERFADAVVAAGGLGLLQRVWEGPQAMPTLAELHDPQRWIARMGDAGSD